MTEGLDYNTSAHCDKGFHVLAAYPQSSCFSQGSWRTTKIAFTKTLFHQQQIILNQSGKENYDAMLTIPLDVGLVVSAQVQGVFGYNNIDFISNSDFPYRLDLIWHHTPPRAWFITQLSGRTGTKDTFDNIRPVKNIDNYTIDIHILETQFKTYVDGHLVMISKMRLPVKGVKRINFWGFRALYKLNLGQDLCPGTN